MAHIPLPTTLNGYPVIAAAPKRPSDAIVTALAVIVRREHPYHPYVVATWNEHCGNEWVWGHYKETYGEAVELFSKML